MAKVKDEKITIEFTLDAEGKITDVKKGDGSPGVVKTPEAPHAWVSAIVATKHSPGSIYIWTGTFWKCIPV